MDPILQRDAEGYNEKDKMKIKQWGYEGMKYSEFKEFMNNIKMLHQTYDMVRIVDPMNKQVLNLNNDELTEAELKCFHLWGDKGVCQNCVSMRAFNENTTFIKLEYSPDKIYMITAIPYDFNNRKIIIEIMKDATNSMLISTSENGDDRSSEIHALINNMNSIAVRDELTGSYNRRYINERLPVDLLASALSEQSISVVLADIDFFKKINDTYGHQTGDDVLKAFANTLTRCLKRNTDWVARYGGEKFLICLPGASHERAVEIAEYMRRSIDGVELICKENELNITASFGVVTKLPSQDMSVDELLSQADKRLYKAKQNGRNGVE